MSKVFTPGWDSSQRLPKDPVSRLVFELAKLPGIGEKTATRLAYYILKQDTSFAQDLADALVQAKAKTGFCRECFTFTDLEICTICADTGRQASIICVVERPTDVLSIEQSGAHTGRYHVLHGALSPLDGVGPDELKIKELLKRLSDPSVSEILLATNPSVEGEATASYLGRLIRPLGLKVTQMAYGLSVGGLLEYTDRQTISRAIQNRVEMG
jgi:recombination protein RecR